jgi:hypothetical protein
MLLDSITPLGWFTLRTPNSLRHALGGRIGICTDAHTYLGGTESSGELGIDAT